MFNLTKNNGSIHICKAIKKTPLAFIFLAMRKLFEYVYAFKHVLTLLDK